MIFSQAYYYVFGRESHVVKRHISAACGSTFYRLVRLFLYISLHLKL
jgi:hypothetical protein